MNLYKYILLFNVLFLTINLSAMEDLESLTENAEEFSATGQTILKSVYLKYCKKKDPKLNGTKLANMKEQDEWDDLYRSGKFSEYVQDVCGIPPGKYKDVHTKYLIIFLWYNASDSGNVPSCS